MESYSVSCCSLYFLLLHPTVSANCTVDGAEGGGQRGGGRGFLHGGGRSLVVVLSRSYAVSAPADRDPSQLDYACLIISGVYVGEGNEGVEI